jgi:enhancer of mRNA-decapping protein 3
MLARAAQNLPSPSSPFIGDVSNVPRHGITQKLTAASQKPRPVTNQRASAKPTATEPAELASEVVNNPAAQETGLKKKSKKTKRREPAVVPVADPPPTMNTEVSRNGNDMNVSVKRGKGWRSTPLLQPSPQPGASTDLQASKKGRRRRDQEQEFAQGDTTDIQDMGDFDFEGELKKFNKKQVFDEIRQGDTTADEDRLVSHNRIHRPGTYGGKNLHPTEPVLSPKLLAQASNDVGSTSDADTELDFPNGRASSRHSITRSVLNKKPSRQNSQHVDIRTAPHPLLPLSATISNRSSSSLVSRSRKPSSMAAISPRPDRSHTPPLTRSIADLAASATETTPEPHFVILPDMSACPTLLPGALDALEFAAVETFGLSADALTESAGRCIAEAAANIAEDSIRRRPSRTSTIRGSMTSSTVLNQPPTSSPTPSQAPVIVVLAGDHVVGARALAAARHLVTHGFHIIAAETVYSKTDAINDQRRTQVGILRKMRAAGAPVRRGRWARAEEHIKHLPGPPAVIIDALLAGTPITSISQNPLQVSVHGSANPSAIQQAEIRSMIDWANRSAAPVLSISVPSGVDGTSGVTTTVDGEPLAVRPARVLALGAPLSGLLRAMLLTGERWPVTLADVGLNIALRKEEGLAFLGGASRKGAAAWTMELEVADDSGEEEGLQDSRIGRVP